MEPRGETLSSNESDPTEDLRSNTTAVGAAIGEMVRTTLGPAGMDKMVVDSNGMALLTNDTKTVLGEINLHLNLVPAARLLTELAIEQDEAVGDGTTATVAVAGELLRKARDLFDRGVHPSTVAHGYTLAARRGVSALADIGVEVNPGDTESVQRVVQTGVAGWGSDQDEATLASLVGEAADELAATGDLDWDRLTVKKVTGGTVADSSLYRGTVYEGDPVHAAMPRVFEPAAIACLNTNLKPKQGSVDHGELTVRDSDTVDRLLDLEAEAVRSQAERVVDCGADVVFSDKSIDDRAQQFFADRGVLAVRRVAESDFHNIVQATGATVTDATVIDTSDLGGADYVEHSVLGGDDVFTIATEDAEHVALVLRGGTEQVLNEMERATRSGFATARVLHRDPYVVPGGGATEMEVSAALHEYADSLDSREQLVVNAFADALETIPRSLAENAGLDPLDAVIELRRRHAAGESAAGVEAVEGELSDAFDADIVDPRHVKRRTIESAADVVARAVRIGGVVPTRDSEEDLE